LSGGRFEFAGKPLGSGVSIGRVAALHLESLRSALAPVKQYDRLYNHCDEFGKSGFVGTFFLYNRANGQCKLSPRAIAMQRFDYSASGSHNRDHRVNLHD